MCPVVQALAPVAAPCSTCHCGGCGRSNPPWAHRAQTPVSYKESCPNTYAGLQELSSVLSCIAARANRTSRRGSRLNGQPERYVTLSVNTNPYQRTLAATKESHTGPRHVSMNNEPPSPLTVPQAILQRKRGKGPVSLSCRTLPRTGLPLIPRRDALRMAGESCQRNEIHAFGCT